MRPLGRCWSRTVYPMDVHRAIKISSNQAFYCESNSNLNSGEHIRVECLGAELSAQITTPAPSSAGDISMSIGMRAMRAISSIIGTVGIPVASLCSSVKLARPASTALTNQTKLTLQKLLYKSENQKFPTVAVLSAKAQSYTQPD